MPRPAERRERELLLRVAGVLRASRLRAVGGFRVLGISRNFDAGAA